MTKTEETLLNNVLDSLDRLYDGDTYAIDVYFLLVATSAALAETEHAIVINVAAARLEPICRTAMSTIERRSQALNVTDDLRLYVAELLPM
jgi:hypothetical protein